jgi:F0F1-type ATP synthase assembly protein I
MRPDPEKPAPSWTRLSGLGMEFVGVVVVFALIGYWADRHWNSSPWGLIVGLAVGSIGSTYSLVRTVAKASREEASSARKTSGLPPRAGDQDL